VAEVVYAIMVSTGNIVEIAVEAVFASMGKTGNIVEIAVGAVFVNMGRERADVLCVVAVDSVFMVSKSTAALNVNVSKG
jgi:hypothetical protein